MKYLLTASYEFDADDDPSARSKVDGLARHLKAQAPEGFAEADVRLRCIYTGKPPRSVALPCLAEGKPK
jgi:hypothetical protein